MLRFLLIALVVANIGYFVWARGEAEAGQGEREPQRLTRQIRPDLLQIRRPDATPAATPAAAPAADGAAAR